MAQYKVEALGPVEPNAFNGLTKVQFMVNGQGVYLFCKPGNEPKEGETLDGDIAPDKAGNMKFTRTKTAWAGDAKPYTGPKKGQSYSRDDNAIRAQWAIGQAVQLNIANAESLEFDHIEADAAKFYAMIERVKSGQQPLPISEERPFTDEEATQALSGKEVEDFFNTPEVS